MPSRFKFACVFITVALSLASFIALPSKASTIVYGGSLIDLGSGWRTASVSKGIFSGSGVLGSDGYYVVGSQGQSELPTYVSSFTPGASIYGGNSLYANIDNPVTTPGASPSLLETGTFNTTIGSNNTGTAFSFTIGSGSPGTIQVGLMVDNLDFTLYNNYAIKLSSSLSGGGPSVSLTSPSYNDRIPDWLFFDITGATAGETFSVLATAGASGNISLGAVSFDAVPEPASILMMGTGILGLAMGRRVRGGSRSR